VAASDGQDRGDAEARDDERTVEALRAGDEAAFLALVERHHRAMVRTAAAFVRSEAVAEEVAQEAWLGVLSGLARFEGRAALRTWIFQIVVNQARARAAREARSVPLSALGDDSGAGPAVPPERFLEGGEWPGHWASPPQAWPDELAASREAVAIVRAALESLPASQRAVMTLRDVEGWDAAEVCELLGLSDGNQRVLLHRARSAVRARLEERLGERGRGRGGAGA
jgi:RNA polymerase sigma-70 factor, ECF subfamily